MNYLKIIALLSITISTSVFAGRSGSTKIDHIVIKKTHVEIYTASTGGCGGLPNRWHLLKTHENYESMLSGFLATRAAGKEVDIVGNGTCPSYEEIDWAFVLK